MDYGNLFSVVANILAKETSQKRPTIEEFVKGLRINTIYGLECQYTIRGINTRKTLGYYFDGFQFTFISLILFLFFFLFLSHSFSIFQRTCMLFLLGLSLNTLGVGPVYLDALRIPGILQRIAITYGVVSVISIIVPNFTVCTFLLRRFLNKRTKYIYLNKVTPTVMPLVEAVQRVVKYLTCVWV